MKTNIKKGLKLIKLASLFLSDTPLLLEQIMYNMSN